MEVRKRFQTLDHFKERLLKCHA